MQVESLSQGEWEEFSAKVGLRDVFSQQAFLSIYSRCYHLGVKYYVVRDKSKSYVLLGCFSKSNSIVIPNYLMFNPFWVNNTIGEVARNKALKILLEYLCSIFTNITLRLPAGYIDIRPFLWQRFDSTLKYTYIKNLSKFDYHENIKRILKKSNTQYTFRHLAWNNEIEERLVPELLHIGFRKSSLKAVIPSFRELCHSGEMLIFAGYLDDSLVAFDLVLEDAYQSKAYMFFISKSYNHYKSGFPAFLYDYVFSQLKERGIEKVDLYGANIPEIAIFKSKFNPELECFYEVNYSRKRVMFRNLEMGLKKFVKSALTSRRGN